MMEGSALPKLSIYYYYFFTVIEQARILSFISFVLCIPEGGLSIYTIDSFSKSFPSNVSILSSPLKIWKLFNTPDKSISKAIQPTNQPNNQSVRQQKKPASQPTNQPRKGVAIRYIISIKSLALYKGCKTASNNMCCAELLWNMIPWWTHETYGTSASSSRSSGSSAFPCMDSMGVEYWPILVLNDLPRCKLVCPAKKANYTEKWVHCNEHMFYLFH